MEKDLVFVSCNGLKAAYFLCGQCFRFESPPPEVLPTIPFRDFRLPVSFHRSELLHHAGMRSFRANNRSGAD